MQKNFVFRHEFFGPLRAAVIDGEAYYAASDLCKALGINNNRQSLVNHLDPCEIKGCVSFQSLNHVCSVMMTAINEDGVYSILVGVKKSSYCKEMKSWLCSEVFPEMRRECADQQPECSGTFRMLAAQIKDEQEKTRRMNTLVNALRSQLLKERSARNRSSRHDKQ